jgi:hypothetical protein
LRRRRSSLDLVKVQVEAMVKEMVKVKERVKEKENSEGQWSAGKLFAWLGAGVNRTVKVGRRDRVTRGEVAGQRRSDSGDEGDQGGQGGQGGEGGLRKCSRSTFSSVHVRPSRVLAFDLLESSRSTFSSVHVRPSRVFTFNLLLEC